jgi:2-polyprenyl-3-methyl-5-hydroxy-6-metoxy-1,4-benzoquinol methylase/predicted nucleic-acid-binding Zn-ribbon protein
VKQYSKINIEKCPLCNSNVFSPKARPKDFRVSNETFYVVSCDGCGHTFTSPRPADEELHKFYGEESYISHTNSDKGLFNKIYLAVKRYATKKKSHLISEVAIKGKILDVGAGTGDFLNACKQQGWDVYGVEPSPIARVYAREQFQIELQTAEAVFNLPKRNFQAITLWHVLEHLPDLNEYFNCFEQLLTEDGTLVIAVPNFESQDARFYGDDWAAWDVPIHISHFSKLTMHKWAKKFGFQIVGIKNMPFDSFYVSMLSEKNQHSKFSFVKGAVQGLLSNLKSGKDNASSLIYIMKKINS